MAAGAAILASPPPRTGLAPMLRAEFAASLAWRHGFVLAALVLTGVVCAFWLTQFPPSVYRFFARVFVLEGWPAIVVANDWAGLMFFVYWIAVFDVLAIVVVPLEEGYLDLLLAKPLKRSTYMLVRLAPALLVAAGIGVLAAAANLLALAAAGLAYDWPAYAGAAAAVVAYAVALASLANLLIIAARDTFTALLIAFVPIFAAFLPGTLFMYRPDLYAGDALLRDIVVFPINLAWYPDFAARWGLALAAAFVALAILLIVFAGHRLERRDVG